MVTTIEAERELAVWINALQRIWRVSEFMHDA